MHDRFTDRRMRRSRERSVDRGPIRSTYSPSIPGPIPGGDRYRPEPAYSSRESFRPARVADCYRPKYDEDKGIRTRDRGSSTDRSRKNSVSGTAADRSPRSVSKWSSRGRSSSRSPSPLPPPLPHASPRVSVPHHEPGIKTLHDSRSGHSTAINDVKVEKSTSELAVATPEKHDSRPPSRSSIASSRPSDRYPAPATPGPSVAVPAPTPPPPSVEPLPIFILDEEEHFIFPSKREHTAPLSPPLSPDRNPPAVVIVDAAELVVTIVKANDIDAASAPQHLITTEYSDASRTGSIRSRSLAPMEIETTSQGSSSRHENLPSPVSSRISRLELVEERQKSDVVDAAQTSPATGYSEELQQQQEHSTMDVHEPSPTPDLSERMPPSPAVIHAEVEHNDVTPHNGQDQETEFTVQDIPSMADAKSLQDALRIIVMTRILCDHQTVEDRVEPVLLSNAAIIPRAEFSSITDGDSWVVESVCSGPWSESPVRQALIDRSAAREAARVAKVRRLQEQYLALHEQWSAQCALLDSMAKPAPAEEPPNPGRTTRRSAANLGDAVRSDLEMEQIIASLGNDELTDPNHLSIRNVADIPDMTSVICGDVDYFFDDTNHLVHDPATFYGPDTGIHDWTEDEKQVFLDKFAEYPKQFGSIAESLPNKTVSQCVDYYYLHKKSVIDFRKAVLQMAPNKRKRGARRGKQKGNGLLADIRQHDDEMHRDSGRPTISGPMTRRKRGMNVLLNDSFRVHWIW